MKSIALYARVSSQQQAQRATIDSQVTALKMRAKTDGHRVLPTDVYIDEGFSGATLVRPALERLRDRIAEGSVEIVYIYDPDRLARRYAYQVLLLEEFASRGTEVVFVNGHANQGPEDTLLTQVQGMIAEYERAKILERNRRGKLHKARQGSVNPLSGAPYGYSYIRRSDTEPARYVIKLDEAKVVRRVFHALANDQKSIGQIVRDLNASNIPTRKRVSRWERTTVWAMLQNPAYRGQAAYGKTEATTRRTLLRPIRNKPSIPRHAKSTHRDKPREQWISIAVPSLVSAEVFAAAGKQLARNKRLSARNGRGQRYLLQGLTVCARCGYAYYGKTVSPAMRNGRPAYGYYRCVGSDSYRFAGGRICHNGQVRVDQLDLYTWNSVKSILQDPERVLAEWSRRAKPGGVHSALNAKRDEAAREVAHYERSLQRLLDAYEAGALELTELTERSERLKTRRKQARQELEELDKRLSETVTLRAVIGRLDEFAERVRGGLDRLNWVERQQLIRTLVARVEIDEEGATVVYRIPSGTGNGPPSTPDDASSPAASDASYHQRKGRTFAAAQ